MNFRGRETFVWHPEVKAALANGEPIVALESTVITHGLPYPHNVEAAAAMETAVRAGGAVPATLAILRGQIHLGLTADQIEALGRADYVRKCSRRDLPIALALGEDGSTTVAGTMIIAHAAGIELFATGGIGGVHRGHPFDVSADLVELGRTPVTVVCSGAKSILDLPLTCEVLETQGVPIVGYGVDELPAFFTRSSGLGVTVRLDTPAQAAALIHARRRLGLQSGTLVTVPVPEADQLPAAEVDRAVERATAKADAAGIRGAATTPWLLRRMAELTDEQSLRANASLLQNNGRIAGQIARALAEIRSRG